jgi:hypothetical protein
VDAEKEGENLVTKEVESWKGFEYALRNRNESLFIRRKRLSQRATMFCGILVYSSYIPAAENNQ